MERFRTQKPRNPADPKLGLRKSPAEWTRRVSARPIETLDWGQGTTREFPSRYGLPDMGNLHKKGSELIGDGRKQDEMANGALQDCTIEDGLTCARRSSCCL